MSKSETNLAWLWNRKVDRVAKAKYSKKKMVKDKIRGTKRLNSVVPRKLEFYLF